MGIHFKQPAKVLPNTEYEISFEAAVIKPGPVMCNFYTYNPNYQEIDGDHVEVIISRSAKYHIRLSTSPEINDKSETYIKIWNDSLNIGDITIKNIQCIKLGTATNTSISGNSNEPGILMVTTWDVNCGIATYSKHLIGSIHKYFNDENIKIISINNGLPSNLSIKSEITHFQHEFGILPYIPKTEGEIIITWHTVPTRPHDEVNRVSRMGAYHIVHTGSAKQALMKSGVVESSITIIPHGSLTFPTPTIHKKAARELLGLPPEKFVVFMFGFRTTNKGYDDILNMDIDGVLLLVTGAPNHNENSSTAKNVDRWASTEHVRFLHKFLSERDVTLHALAADALIFNYADDNTHISSSGAMHRIIDAGRPIICTDIPQFEELENNMSALKIKHPGDIEKYIRMLMNDSDLAEKLGENARTVAEETSWEVVAHKHMGMYNKIREMHAPKSWK